MTRMAPRAVPPDDWAGGAFADVAGDRRRLRQRPFEPHVLHRDGLGAAIRLLLEDLAKVTDIDYRLDDRTSSEARGATGAVAFLVARAALANVEDHARARMVHVALSGRFGGIDVRIIDDGAGFEVVRSAASPQRRPGLAWMRARVEDAGGSFRIDSCPGLGTTVGFWLPEGISEIQDDGIPGRRAVDVSNNRPVGL